MANVSEIAVNSFAEFLLNTSEVNQDSASQQYLIKTEAGIVAFKLRRRGDFYTIEWASQQSGNAAAGRKLYEFFEQFVTYLQESHLFACVSLAINY